MTKTFYLIVASAFLLAGCQEMQNAETPNVVVVGGEDFPPSLAGRWVSDRAGWQIVFDARGGITSVVLGLGQVEIVPGVKATVPTRGGGEGTFEPGPWTVDYEAETSRLTVKIVMDHIHIEMGSHVLDGKSGDVFSGPISATDGLWQTQWTAFTDYQVRTPDGESVTVATDPIYGETQPLTFRKSQPQ